MVDVARDPRWGRVAEGAGEDTFLGMAMARARVRGFQAADLASGRRIVACPKHYAAYGAAEAGRDYNTVDISRAHCCARCICRPSRRPSTPAPAV